MTRQTPALTLPSLSGIPTSYEATTYTGSEKKTLDLARSLAQLGLGAADMLGSQKDDLSTFIRCSLREWLAELGTDQLDECVGFQLDVSCPNVAEAQGKYLISLGTTNHFGGLELGKALQCLEEEHKGLGSAYYLVLMTVLNAWTTTYSIEDTKSNHEYWRESIECNDIEVGKDGKPVMSFEEHCEKNDIDIPNLDSFTPQCIKNIALGTSTDASISLLKKHRQGKYAAWIEPVLAMASVHQPKLKEVPDRIAYSWDDGRPLPNWLVYFSAHDPITQAFDEEAEIWMQCDHHPTWVQTFDPSDVNDVRRVLEYVQSFVLVNLEVVKIVDALYLLANAGHRAEFADDEEEGDSDELMAA